MSCECLGSMAGYGPESFGLHHHKNCTGYEQQKHWVLFYYDEGLDAWTLPTDLDCMVGESYNGDEVEIRFKYIEYTDKEIDEMPEI